MSRDYDDCHRFYQWLEVRNLFNIEDTCLHSLATGVVSITGKETTRVRTEKSLDGHSFHEAKFKRPEKLITLDYLPRNFEVDKSPMVVNPVLLFKRQVIVRREDDVEKYFHLELTIISLFKDKLMRKSDKALLCNIFLTAENL